MNNAAGGRPMRLAAGRSRAQGLPTRGTTAPNRLRRMDRWIVGALGPRLRSASDPLVVDLGFGASAATTVELHSRLRQLRRDVEVLGLEIDPDRVSAAQHWAGPGLRFQRGGFELAGHRPVLVRVANVLRQYPESAVAGAWELLCSQLAPAGAVIEGTTDEFGRRGSWVLLERAGPVSLTLSCAPEHLDTPSGLAERLVKALIHHNVAGERIHSLLAAMDSAWASSAPLAVFGPRQRWQAMADSVAKSWPVLSTHRQHRGGEITISWDALMPFA